MVLNLLLSHTPDQIRDLLSHSFATFVIIRGKSKKSGPKPFEDEHKILWEDFLHHLDFLKETGYVTQDGALTADGIWASQLRVDQPLMIAEGFRRGVFPESDPGLLAAMTTLFVNERESDDRIEKAFTPRTFLAAFVRVQKDLGSFAGLMADRGFEVRPVFLRPAAAIYAWAMGQPWEKVLGISEMEEGDLAMLILRTADNLRHIRSLKRVFPEAALTSATSIDLILRSPVAMEYDIG
jgi:superfamily II RNA helicase